jgi:hypothetical protein
MISLRHFSDQIIYLVLHPKYKLKYFEKLKWEDDWVKTVDEIVREEFKRNYEEYRLRDPKTSQSLGGKVSIIFITIVSLFQGFPVPQ